MKWEECLKIESKDWFIERIISYTKEFDPWKKMNDTEKIDCIKNLVAPFTYTEKDIIDIISKINEE